MAERSFRSGDRVRFQWGIRAISGKVKEDRGPIGVRGRHLYLVEFHPESQSPTLSQIELPAEALQAIQGTGSPE